MREPLEYGDNFPVPASGSWDPTVPWRFPRREIHLRTPSPLARILPWITLGLGLTLGVLWVNLTTDLASTRSTDPASRGQIQSEIQPQGPSSLQRLAPSPEGQVPSSKPYKVPSRLA